MELVSSATHISFQAIYSQDWPLTPPDTQMRTGNAVCLTVQVSRGETTWSKTCPGIQGINLQSVQYFCGVYAGVCVCVCVCPRPAISHLCGLVGGVCVYFPDRRSAICAVL